MAGTENLEADGHCGNGEETSGQQESRDLGSPDFSPCGCAQPEFTQFLCLCLSQAQDYKQLVIVTTWSQGEQGGLLPMASAVRMHTLSQGKRQQSQPGTARRLVSSPL